MLAYGINPHDLRTAMLELLTFLGSSARGTLNEPKLYGPLRLIEAAQRVINLMDCLGVSDIELNTLAERFIDDAIQISTDEIYCAKFIDEITTLFAKKLRDA